MPMLKLNPTSVTPTPAAPPAPPTPPHPAHPAHPAHPPHPPRPTPPPRALAPHPPSALPAAPPRSSPHRLAPQGVDLDNAGEFLKNGANSIGLVAPLFPADAVSLARSPQPSP